MVLRKYQDEDRDRETLVAVRAARGAMEAVEYAFFKEGTATAEDGKDAAPAAPAKVASKTPARK